jgi:hypothetical protein
MANHIFFSFTSCSYIHIFIKYKEHTYSIHPNHFHQCNVLPFIFLSGITIKIMKLLKSNCHLNLDETHLEYS